MESMQIDSKSVPTEGSSVLPKPSKPGRKRSRGKPSAKKHDEAFRTRVGTEAQKDIKNNILNAHPTLEDATASLARLMVSSDPVTIELPITLRGLGFMVKEAYSMACVRLKPNIEPPMSLNSFYRIVLAQAQLQIIRSTYLRKGLPATPKRRSQTLIQPWMNFDQQVASHPATLKGVALLINSIGSFTHDGTSYDIYVPDSAFQYTSESSGPQWKRKRDQNGVSRAVHQGPDPYVTTLTNLRSTVVSLSTPGTPLPIRKFYHDHCALPGAVWEDDYILSNPDEIMPDNYGYIDLQLDFQRLERFIAILPGRAQTIVGHLRFDGSGTVAQLASVESDSWLDPGYTSSVSERVYAPRCLSDHDLFLGELLYLEYPLYSGLAHSLAEESEFALRSIHAAVRVMHASWQCVAESVLRVT